MVQGVDKQRLMVKSAQLRHWLWLFFSQAAVQQKRRVERGEDTYVPTEEEETDSEVGVGRGWRSRAAPGLVCSYKASAWAEVRSRPAAFHHLYFAAHCKAACHPRRRRR